MQEPEKLNPLTQLQVAYVMGLRDSNSALQAQQPRKAVKLNPHDIDMLSFSYFGHNTAASMTHVYRAFAQQIEQAVLKANGVET